MVSRGMLTTVALRCPGEMCAIMIVSEQLHPIRPPIAALCPDLVSDPSSKMFRALVYLGGRLCESILGTCVIPDSSILNAANTPAVITITMAVRQIAVQPSIFARRDRMRIIEALRSSGTDRPAAGLCDTRG